MPQISKEAFTVSRISLFLDKIDPNPQHLKKRISIETRFFTKCISINLYLILNENQRAN